MAEQARAAAARLRVIVVDDEPLARRRIRALLAEDPEVEVVGEYGDGLEAVAGITGLRPDLVFLDVQMPELDGFGVLQALRTTEVPAVVFVTAFEEYALKAFAVHALDYLLKPFDPQRFRESVARVKATLHGGAGEEDFRQRVLAALAGLRGDRRTLERILVRSGGRVTFLKVGEIDWIEADGNYLRLHAGKTSHLIRDTMAGMEAALDGDRFVRIHRSTIVNVERIKELEQWFHGDWIVALADGTRLTLSRSYRHRLDALGPAR